MEIPKARSKDFLNQQNSKGGLMSLSEDMLRLKTAIEGLRSERRAKILELKQETLERRRRIHSVRMEFMSGFREKAKRERNERINYISAIKKEVAGVKEVVLKIRKDCSPDMVHVQQISKSASPSPSLNKEAVKILELLKEAIEGMRLKEISSRLNITNGDVRRELKDLMNKNMVETVFSKYFFKES